MAQDESPSTSSDPCLSRNVSFSRLNARAPEFIPSPRSDLHTISPPSPPPPAPPQAQGVLQVYQTSQSPSFHVPIHSLVPSHVIPSIQNHHHHPPHPHHPHHHHNHPHPLPLQYQHHHQYYAAAASGGGGGGFADHEVVGRQQQPPAADSLDHSAPSKNKLSDEASLKILNQVSFAFPNFQSLSYRILILTCSVFLIFLPIICTTGVILYIGSTHTLAC